MCGCVYLKHTHSNKITHKFTNPEIYIKKMCGCVYLKHTRSNKITHKFTNPEIYT